jgi:hypothetical protein
MPPAARRSTQEPAANASLEHTRIARLAYAYWQARGCPAGSPEEDWLRAEDELRRRQSAWKAKKEQRRRVPRSRRSPRTAPC